MPTRRVLVTDKLAEEGLASLREEPGIEVVVNTKLAQDSAGLQWRSKQPMGSSFARERNSRRKSSRTSEAQGHRPSGCRRRQHRRFSGHAGAESWS